MGFTAETKEVTVRVQMNMKEIEALYNFAKDRGGYLFTLFSSETGIGNALKVHDNKNKEQQDITDYDSW